MATSAACIPWNHVALTLSPVLSTGLHRLDRCLPGGGWPLGEITELVGADEAPLQALLPALSALSWEDRWITLISPPAAVRRLLGRQRGCDLSRFRQVHAHPRLSTLDSAFRAVASGQSAAVAAWVGDVAPGAIETVRAALADTGCVLFLLRPPAALSQAPAGALRLHVARESGAGLRIRLLHVAWSRQVAVALAAEDVQDDRLPPALVRRVEA